MTIETGNPTPGIIEDEMPKNPFDEDMRALEAPYKHNILGDKTSDLYEGIAKKVFAESDVTKKEPRVRVVTESDHANRWERMSPKQICAAHSSANAAAREMHDFDEYRRGADRAISGMLESLRTRSVSGVVAYDMLLREKFHLERKDYLDETELSVAASLLTMSMY